MTKYFGVIGNRDHIKINGERRPFWEFLDRQPDGWLSSLAYLPLRDFVMPKGVKIADCGAWSYKDKETPKLGKNEVTPGWALGEYQKYFDVNDLVVAPDHMLIPGANLKLRRRFNIESAQQFLPIAKAAGFRPMATVHGMDLDERLINIGRLYEMGYRHFSLGGMAARASQKRVLLESIAMLKNKIRSLLPDAYIHVLGLSSPEYWAAFNELGINSCDGSSHFKQAFTGGVFFNLHSGKLTKNQAVRVDKETREPLAAPSFPECGCKSCSKLRTQGVDTRCYGSNESNMGRAAHNLNMLMQAQSVAAKSRSATLRPIMSKLNIVREKGSPPSVCLIACTKEKSLHPAKTFELYTSKWFQKAEIYSRKFDQRFVLSALHGLLNESQIVEPYEKTLLKMPAVERSQWAKNVFCQIAKTLPYKTKISILAGKYYRDKLIPLLEDAGYVVDVPMKGLGIGRQLAWFNSQGSTQTQLL